MAGDNISSYSYIATFTAREPEFHRLVYVRYVRNSKEFGACSLKQTSMGWGDETLLLDFHAQSP